MGLFKDKFQNKFQINSYEEQWDTLQQGRKKIEEYIDDFQRLQAKVDPEGNLPAPTMLKKFVRV